MKKILSLTVFILSLTAANAQIEWEQVPLPDTVETVYSFYAVDDQNYLMGTDHGIYRSDDAGVSWMFEQVSGSNFSCYTINIGNGKYYHTNRGDLYVKETLDSPWEFLYADVDNVLDICFPNDSTILLGSWGGISRSTDSGNTWEHVFTTINEAVRDIVVHPNGYVFAGTYGSCEGVIAGVYRSTDNGATWERIGLDYSYIFSLTIDSYGSIYAGRYGHHYTGFGGVLQSDDLGETWTELTTLYNVTSIISTPGDTLYIGSIYWEGVYSSTDYGETWENVNGNIGYTTIRDLSLGKDGRLNVIIYASNKIYRTVKSVTVGLENQPSNNNNVLVYPNPVSDNLFVEHPDNNSTYNITIFDMRGKKELCMHNQSGNAVVNVAGLNNGIYFLKIISNNQTNTFKIIKK